MKKIGQRIIAIFTIAAVVFYSLAPTLVISVNAQESTPSASEEQIVEPSPSPSKTPTPSLETTPSPTPTPSLDESLTIPQASESAIIDTSSTENQSSASLAPPLWQENPDGSATTTDPVTLNTTYKAPQNDKVSVTFTKLPEEPGTLIIKQIILSQEDKEDLGAFSETAYEITSTMMDGTFTYDLTLPLPPSAQGQNVEVIAGESVDTLDQAETLDEPKTQENDVIKITGLDHFTVFVLVNNIVGDDENEGTFDDVANGQIVAIKDAWINETPSNQNNGAATSLQVRSQASSRDQRTLIQFDLPSIDSGSEITKVTLRLFMTSAPDVTRTYEVYRIPTDWVEGNGGTNNIPVGEVRWDNQPDISGLTATSTTQTGTQGNVWIEFNVTSDVEAFIAGTDNFGWLIKDQTENSSTARQANFRSKESGVENERPQLVLDFAAPSDQPTQYNSPTASEADPDAGDGNGFENTPLNAFSDGGSEVVNRCSGNLTNTLGYASNCNGAGDRHIFRDFNFDIPVGSIINGIEVRADWFLDSTTGVNSLDIDLSWDEGATWTSAKSDATETSREHVVSFGSASDIWDRGWEPAEFSNTNFRVRVSTNSDSSGRDFALDFIGVRVYYEVGNVCIEDGDCFFTIQEAIDAAPLNSTINVAAGNYSEKLSINKSLTLTGAGVENSTITESDSYCDGTPTLSIETDDVTVENFTVNNDGCDGSVIWISGGYTAITIQNNKLINGYYGIELSGGSSDIQILNNQIFNNDGDGIYSSGEGALSSLTINGNEIGNQDQPNGDSGIYLDQLTGTIVISANTVSYSPYNGVYLGTISEATVTIGGENESDGNTITNNSYEGLYISSVDNDSTVSILNNIIESNNTAEGSDTGGIYIDFIGQSPDTLTIQDNSISQNNGQGVYVNLVQFSTLNVAGNTIDNNTAQGIYLEQASGSEITIGESNTITNNDDAGIYLGSVTGVSITGNTIQNNGVESESTGIVVQSASENEAHENIISGNGDPGVGVENSDGENFFDARENWWGDATGPLNETSNPEGLGDSVGDNVFYRPFYTDSAKDISSTFEVSGTSFNPSSLFTTGLFSLPDGTTDQTSTPSVTVNEEFTISVVSGDGTSSVLLPAGTTITRVGGGELDSTLLDSSDVDTDDLSGFTSGEVVDGAMQWGIPNLGLEFSQIITLNIYVGTALNGQTLNVVRSTTRDGGWISDGIGPPTTCVVGAVTSGLCTFTATKASYYATTHTTTTTSSSSSSSGGGGGGGVGDGTSTQPPVCNDTKPGSAPVLLSATAGINFVILTWSEASNPVTYYLATYGESSGAQTYGNPNIGGKGTTTYTVSGLSGGQTYYFRVRAGNGCAPGDYSNEISATPVGVSLGGPAVGFAPGVLEASTEVVTGEAEGGVEGVTQEVSSISEGPIPQTPLAGFLAAIGSFLAAIISFFGRILGR